MSGPTAKKLYLTRHAQAEHNVDEDWSIADAPLTPLGQNQSKRLNELSQGTIQKTADLLVSSPMRRPLETLLLGYPELKTRLEAEGKPVIILDILQEVNAYPCDTPSHPISAITEWRDGLLSGFDFSSISPDYASKKGIFDPERVVERAREVRRWLRDRPEQDIVVVAHGDILRNIADGKRSGRPWANAEVKVFTFVSESDEDASLVEIGEVAPVNASEDPTSSGVA
ncbi:histidine phosphatase superfamily [Kockovaella imperatae]|uniref:Histidine phosphatase superfamily n=1 Tax=Kockovaella imperatae TaxID=4999 RepID=A0A1Y1UDL4_9TREE|nr:histidine phosphatase superfamily [Kockovaella imperatae]ORX35637.1 histidine phosphatase superfamily [Kockovaella imperatae]